MSTVGSLSNIVAAVHGDPILSNFTPPNGGTPVAVSGLIGEAGKSAKQTPPYVVWIPSSDRFDLVMGQKSGPTQPAFPRLILTRWMGIEAHISCAQGPNVASPFDFDQVDVLLNSFIAALHRQARGSYRLTGGRILATAGQELVKGWKVYVLTLEIAVPITETAATASLATITAETQPASMTFPDGTQVPSGGPAFPPP